VATTLISTSVCTNCLDSDGLAVGIIIGGGTRGRILSRLWKRQLPDISDIRMSEKSLTFLHQIGTPNKNIYVHWGQGEKTEHVNGHNHNYFTEGVLRFVNMIERNPSRKFPLQIKPFHIHNGHPTGVHVRPAYEGKLASTFTQISKLLIERTWSCRVS